MKISTFLYFTPDEIFQKINAVRAYKISIYFYNVNIYLNLSSIVKNV